MTKTNIPFKRIILIVLFFLFAGVLLQLFFGQIEIDKLDFPINLIAGIQFLIILAAMRVFLKSTAFVSWLSSAEAALTSVFCIILLVLLMALIPQQQSDNIIATRLGLNNIAFSWYFVLSVVFMLTSLALVSLRRLLPFSSRNLMFFVNHFGLFLAVFAALLGQADKKQLFMPVHLNQTVWYAENSKNEVCELPFALRLEKFVVKYHPPKIAFIDTNGKVLDMKGNSENEAITGRSFSIGSYRLTTNEFIDSLQSATITIVKANKSVINVNISNSSDISALGFMFIGKDTLITMLPAEPSYFGSEVLLYTKSGITARPVTIAVNKPLRAEAWDIYQHSYDNIAGSDSQYTVFYLVYDPWLPVVYVGIALMLAGALMLLFHRIKRPELKI